LLTFQTSHIHAEIKSGDIAYRTSIGGLKTSYREKSYEYKGQTSEVFDVPTLGGEGGVNSGLPS
jgi:hypothetical protein